ncbi:thyrotropin-releasing hormone receptor-like [Patiria miniata]|uniref:G-protein coupled receptors family 1 profile domain-containing protein n=1 Tax=Patiria miniata TaxID=46514 RepID=A0A914AFU9_PATMI|nr:thyrotropin-releasing hormone receptor-like [Patiria miniata]
MGAEITTEEDCTENNTDYKIISSREEADYYNLLLSDLEKTTTKIVLPILLALGLIGNIGFLFTVLRVRSMRTATNFYLSNLAVADLMFLLIVIGARLRAYVMYGLPNKVPLLGQAGCILDTFWKYVFNFAGLILITFISFERFIAVCHPLRHRLISGRSRSVKLIVVCWLVALLLALLVIPANFNFKKYCISWNTADPGLRDKFPAIIGRCENPDVWAFQMFHLVQTVPFFVAFFGNSFFYTRILLKLHQRDTHDRQRTIRTRNQVAVMLVANGTVFLLTMTSFEVTSLLIFIDSFLASDLIPPEIKNTLFEINRILVYVNSVVNPLVYTLTNARYRRAFKTAFTLRSCKSSGRQRSSTVTSVLAHDLYQINDNQTRACPENNVTPTRGQYLNICFENDDQDAMANESVRNATTVFT